MAYSEEPTDVYVQIERQAEFHYNLLRNEYHRLYTFEVGSWRPDYVTAQKLARAGFFNMVERGHTMCVFCKGVLSDWEPDDDPIAEHRVHYPHCPFVRGHDVGNIPRREDPYFRGYRRGRGRDVCGGFTPRDNNLSQRLAEYGVIEHTSRPRSNATCGPALEENEAVRCKICLDCDVTVVLLPCGHLICNNCVDSLVTCHICRVPIKGTAKIYFC